MFGLLKSERDETAWCYEARDVLGFVGEGMSERDAATRAGVSAEELRGWKRQKGFRAALRQARRNKGGLTAQGICNLAQLMPPETDVEAGERERREREQVDPPGSLWGPTYGPRGWG
jgi:transposase